MGEAGTGEGRRAALPPRGPRRRGRPRSPGSPRRTRPAALGAREFKTRLLLNGSREAPATLLPGRGRVCRVAAALRAGVASARASAAERLFTAL